MFIKQIKNIFFYPERFWITFFLLSNVVFCYLNLCWITIFCIQIYYLKYKNHRIIFCEL